MDKWLTNRGISLVEVVVGTAIILLALTGIITAYNVFVRVGSATLNTIQASLLLEEGVEAVSVMRDYGWSSNIGNLSVGTKYYLSWNGSRWIGTVTATTTGIYTRYFILQNVSRDSNDDIVASGGTPDPGTKKLTINVAWLSVATTTSRSVSTYITNLFNN